ncbi:glycosyltransferase [Pseudoalteromonas sp. TAB23]|uniref:glycosyltransferase n=1 Tax=Pseudoalteromonas sp. TAB23 TaxID=1938595 RepID=UPI000411AD44|nr:glycosyltransferase [Pseudoalteromonas sp. TAB23]
MKKIIINASNLHVGGGVQVAVSFISEFLEIINKNEFSDTQFDFIISKTVKDNLSTSFNLSRLNVVNVYGYTRLSELPKALLETCDIFFTIFGPIYFRSNSRVEITGFAQPWIAYPDNLAYRQLGIGSRIKNKLIFQLKNYFFKRSNKFIVEAQHVKDALIAKRGYSKRDIYVVSNTVSAIYDTPELWKPIKIEKSNLYTIGFMGRNYPHKNLKRLNEVNKILISKYNFKCRFLLTLSDAEMAECGFETEVDFISTGPLTIEQCPTFYKKIDALIFPSLLECFSATPVEALKMGTLVIASDLPFIRGVCEDSARYFDPMDNESIALAIFNSCNEHEKNEQFIQKGRLLIEKLPSAQDRAQLYLKILLNL